MKVGHLLTVAIAVLLAVVAPTTVLAQTATLRGTVTNSVSGAPVAYATVQVRGSWRQSRTGEDGAFTMMLASGRQTIFVARIGFAPLEISVDLEPGADTTIAVMLHERAVMLGEIVVSGASRTLERVVDAPAAVSSVRPGEARDYSATSQVPMLVGRHPGIDAPQSGLFDFNLNARGFNTTFNRRILVLQDGRDLALPSIGSMEWATFSQPLEDMGQIELVRGPGSALYGANAYNGVLNIITPHARDLTGGQLSVAGGELATLRADARIANVFGGSRFGYRLNGGVYRSRSWSRSRTAPGALAQEYAAAIDVTEHPIVAPVPGFELRPLSGQQTSGVGTPPTGTPDELQNLYGSATFEYYARNGSIATVEGGAGQSENQVQSSAIGRIQYGKVLRPWARAAITTNHFHVMTTYSGRRLLEPQLSLASGAMFEDESGILHGEAQYNRFLADGRMRFVVGASARTTRFNSKGTLVAPADDDRHDETYSGFGQFELSATPDLRVVVAGRIDGGDLFDTQYTGRAAVVYDVRDGHALRATISRAFQTPNLLERFVAFPAGLPLDLTSLEADLRASSVGPSLANVPNGQLFTMSNAVPQWVLGNRNLDVEKILSVEIGYKGEIGRSGFLEASAYFSHLTDFVTDILPGANPTYGPWTPPTSVPAADRQAVTQTAIQLLLQQGRFLEAAGLTRLADGSTAVVLSQGNAGIVDEYGVEIGMGVELTEGVMLEGNYTLFRYDVDSTSLIPGDQLLPNTPQHKGNVSVTYSGEQGIDLRLSGQFVAAYDWASGLFVGPVPARQFFDASAAYQVTDRVRFTVLGTNIFDQRRYQVFGGDVIGRRILGGVSVGY